jgi:hypothetical protein
MLGLNTLCIARRVWPPPWPSTRLLGSIAVMLATSACTPDPDAVATGELGNGWFEYRCDGPHDPICVDPTVRNVFPSCLSLGGSFDLRYHATDKQFSGATLEPASSHSFAGAAPHFTATSPGRSAIVAKHEDRIVDFIHFRVEAPSEIILLDGGSDFRGELVLEPGSTRDLVLYADRPCSPVGGSLWGRALSADSSIATAHVSETLRVTAQAPGTTELLIELGELERTLVVVVTSPSVPPPTRTSASSGSDDAGSSSGSSTDGGTDTDATDTDGTGEDETAGSSSDGSTGTNEETSTTGG